MLSENNQYFLNVKDFGATADGSALDTEAVQAAVDRASVIGGTVYFPRGVYLIGTVYLKSNITISVSIKAKILGSTDLADYSEDIVPCIEAPSFNKVLFYSEDEENLFFTGGGLIDGQGAAFDSSPEFRIERPMLFRFVNCGNIKFDGIRLKDSASWCCHMIHCNDVLIHNTNLNNHANRNNDGFDLDSCEDVFVSNTRISSIDDAICLKSTSKSPCKNIVISNCILSSETAVIKLGTSSRAGFHNIAISNCVFHDCPMGTVKLLCVDGGILENITINNITMENVGSPLFVKSGKRNLQFDKPQENDFWGKGESNDRPAGIIRNILITNIRAEVTVTDRDKTPIMISGLEESKIENITLSNLNITFPGGGTQEDCQRVVDEDPFRYPEQSFFGILPAYALYARHIDGLYMDNVRFLLSGEDKRDAIIYDNVCRFCADKREI